MCVCLYVCVFVSLSFPQYTIYINLCVSQNGIGLTQSNPLGKRAFLEKQRHSRPAKQGKFLMLVSYSFNEIQNLKSGEWLG